MKAFWVTSVMLFALAIPTGSAMAKGHDKDKDHDRDDHRVTHRDRDHDRDDVRRHHRDNDDDRDHDRDDHHFRRTHGEPPGWSHGKKEGWGGCDVPPGQAKKVGCHPYHRHGYTHHTAKSAPKPVALPRPGAEVHAHAGVDAKVH